MQMAKVRPLQGCLLRPHAIHNRQNVHCLNEIDL